MCLGFNVITIVEVEEVEEAIIILCRVADSDESSPPNHDYQAHQEMKEPIRLNQ